MAEVNFNETINGLLSGMKGYISTKTVVGEAITLADGTVLVPLVDVSFGVGAGAFNKEAKNKAGGGMGGKMTPSAVLLIKDGNTRMVSIKDQDTMSRMFDMLPDVLTRLKKLLGKDKDDAAAAADVPEDTVNALANELLKEK